MSLHPTWCCENAPGEGRTEHCSIRSSCQAGDGALTPPVCLSPYFSASLQVTVCWVEEVPASNEQSLSPQAEHAGIRTYFFSAENTEEQESWIQAMGEAARVQIPPTQRSEHCPRRTGLETLLCLLGMGWGEHGSRMELGSVSIPLRLWEEGGDVDSHPEGIRKER